MLHQENIVAQQHSSLTQTPLSAITCQQCHVELCHELSRTHHYYGPYLLSWRSTYEFEESCKVENS